MQAGVQSPVRLALHCEHPPRSSLSHTVSVQEGRASSRDLHFFCAKLGAVHAWPLQALVSPQSEAPAGPAWQRPELQTPFSIRLYLLGLELS